MSIQTIDDGTEVHHARVEKAISAIEQLSVTDRVRAFLKSLTESDINAVEEMLKASPEFFADLDTDLREGESMRQNEA